MTKISVVICTNSQERLHDLKETVTEIISLTDNPAYEIVLVVPDETLREDIEKMVTSNVLSVFTEPESVSSLSEARNYGAEKASGDVYLFIDDDAVPQTNVVGQIRELFEQNTIYGCGGHPRAVAKTPDVKRKFNRRVPETFHWLVGGMKSTDETSVEPRRNTYGCCIAFRADVFDQLGGFDENLGKDNGFNLQGEETELCIRLHKKAQEDNLTNPFLYDPSIRLNHYVYHSQVLLFTLIQRAFLQGVTKGYIDTLHNDKDLEPEEEYLRTLFSSVVDDISRSNAIVRSLLVPIFALIYTVSVIVGYGFEIAFETVS